MNYWKESKLDLVQAKAVCKAITDPGTQHERNVVADAVSESVYGFVELYNNILYMQCYDLPRKNIMIAVAAKKYIASIEATISENVGENDPYKDC